MCENITLISDLIENYFRENYSHASQFYPGNDETGLYERSMQIICNPENLALIILNNEKGIPPVETVLIMLIKQ